MSDLLDYIDRAAAYRWRATGVLLAALVLWSLTIATTPAGPPVLYGLTAVATALLGLHIWAIAAPTFTAAAHGDHTARERLVWITATLILVAVCAAAVGSAVASQAYDHYAAVTGQRPEKVTLREALIVGWWTGIPITLASWLLWRLRHLMPRRPTVIRATPARRPAQRPASRRPAPTRTTKGTR